MGQSRKLWHHLTHLFIMLGLGHTIKKILPRHVVAPGVGEDLAVRKSLRKAICMILVEFSVF